MNHDPLAGCGLEHQARPALTVIVTTLDLQPLAVMDMDREWLGYILPDSPAGPGLGACHFELEGRALVASGVELRLPLGHVWHALRLHDAQFCAELKREPGRFLAPLRAAVEQAAWEAWEAMDAVTGQDLVQALRDGLAAGDKP